MCGVRTKSRPTVMSRSGQLPQEVHRRMCTFLFVEWSLSTIYASKAVPSSKSDWTLSRRADRASTAKK